jgi:ABC-2 type transport system ATP-binding protein
LQHKIIDLKLQDPIPAEGLDLPGTTILKTSTYGAKLQVNTADTTMEAIISTLVSRYHVADITIEDPPMEQIIAAIYNQAAGAGPGARGQGPVTEPVEREPIEVA